VSEGNHPERNTLEGAQPLEMLDEWEDFMEGHHRQGKSEEEFRV
jgi:hypothetical protein